MHKYYLCYSTTLVDIVGKQHRSEAATLGTPFWHKVHRVLLGLKPIALHAPALHSMSCRFGSSHLHQDAFAAEKPAPRKREVAQPRPGFLLEDVKMETITPIPYDIIKEGLQQ